MSDYMSDLSGYYAQMAAAKVGGTTGGPTIDNKSRNSLDMTDFLQLIVAQFTNQSMDNAADTTDMLNQMVQMSTVQAITNITDATVMMYAGSLVGKHVTVGEIQDGKLVEIYGEVTGTGVAGGQQVIFVNDKSYYLSDIMAVGKLPEIEKPEEGEGEDQTPEDDLKPDHPIEKPGEGGETDETQDPGKTPPAEASDDGSEDYEASTGGDENTMPAWLMG